MSGADQTKSMTTPNQGPAVLSFIVILIADVAIFAVIGRLSTPRPERRPLREWRFPDLFANFVNGLTVCAFRHPGSETPKRLLPTTRNHGWKNLRSKLAKLVLTSDVTGSHGKLR